MIDPIARELADRVAASTPTTVPHFEEVRRRARRERLRGALLAAGTAAVVASVAIAAWSLRASTSDSSPDRPLDSPTVSEEPTPSRPDPTYKDTAYPSGLVARLPDRDVDLPADTSCWTDRLHCRRALLLPGSDVPYLGRHGMIDFWFARPGWSFSAVFRRAGEECPRSATIEAIRTDRQWFRLTPAGPAGRYDVELHGRGPEGIASTRFSWTTSIDGPLDPPEGMIGLFPESRGEGTFGLEVMLDDLAFQPAASDVARAVEVGVTSSDGSTRTLSAPLIPESLDCHARGSRGSFYFQREWNSDFAEVGPGPHDIEVELSIRGTTYVGRATWDEAKARTSPYAPLTFTPPLPGAEAD